MSTSTLPSAPDARRSTLASLAGIAWKESRTTRRRLLLYMSSIALGVAALVAIDSYAGNITQSIREQSKALLGGDVAFTTRRDFPPPIDSLFDSLGTQGVTIARITTFASMAMIPRSGGTRLVQVRGVSEAYPLYGAIVTEPAGAFATFQQGAHALIDPSLLISLNAEVGDTLTLGYGRFVITGALTTIPGDPGVAAAVAPRVLIPERFIADTKLLTLGSRAEYEAFAKLPASAVPGKFVAQIRPMLDKNRVRARTVVQNEEGLTASIDQLSDFLGIVGIVALLLGGIGVASGVHAWVARKIDTVAVLRCLGATSGQVLLIYATQAAVMGLVGASIGAVIGIGIQFALPQVVGDLLPVDVRTQLEPRAILTGLGLGVWIALAFALRPLIALRRVSPLQALRRELDPAPIRRGWKDWPRLLVNGLILASVVGIASTRAQGWQQLAGFSGGIAGVVVVLALSAGFLSWLARKALRAGWPYVVRQGVANLYRPANQTRAVVLSLGFGAFLITTLYLVQSNLLQQLTITTEAARGNLLFFDVQDDQGAGVDSIVRAAGHEIVQSVPIVTMRVSAINGRPVNVAMMDSATRGASRDTTAGAGARDTVTRDNAWAFRREYRSTYRAEMVPTERLLSGKWFAGDTTGLPQVSLEREIAQTLGVSLGDTITWDVQGVKVLTRLTSTREVNWARFEPNFFAVFEPRALQNAPKMLVVLSNVPEGPPAAAVQRDIVRRYPNIASIDLSLVRRTVGEIARKATLAIRFLAIFSLAMGVPVLFSAVAATRRDRIREGVLLKTLGATKAQIGRILFAEYALLGILGSLTGMVLSFGGAWALMRFVFQQPFTPATGPALGIAAAMLGITVTIGVLSGRDVFRETAMGALREA